MFTGKPVNPLGLQPRKRRLGENQPRRTVPKVLTAILLLLSLATIVSAQDGATAPLPGGIDNKAPDPAPAPAATPDASAAASTPAAAPADANAGAASSGGNASDPTPAAPAAPEPAQDEFLKPDANYTGPRITDIYPRHGPTTGNTLVIVRGGPFAKYVNEHPEPKCKFGDAITSGTYVPCPPTHRFIYGFEGKHDSYTDLCVQCENSPPLAKPDNVNVTFTMSLDGYFKDVQDSTWFEYYKPTKISAIKPSFGPKDGGTVVQVWGEGFIDYGEETTCSFGVKISMATVINENYMTCVAPMSDVVNRPMPFGASLNGQQFTKQSIDFWYYNDPQVTSVNPEVGPEKGGTLLEIRGENFLPFHNQGGEVDMSNSTFCFFVETGIFTKANIKNTTRATCKTPPMDYYRDLTVELTLNKQDRTDDKNVFHYYHAPFIDNTPKMGPVRGGTVVTIKGSQFVDTGNITCRFGDPDSLGAKVVPAKRISSSELECTSPKVDAPKEVDIIINVFAGLDITGCFFEYYPSPQVSVVAPSCGPLSGFTQLGVSGKNFRDYGRDQLMCAFKQEDASNLFVDGGKSPYVLTNASRINDTFLFCDSPSLLNKQGYAVDADNSWFDVYVSIDGGNEISDTHGRFEYYTDPFINEISPALGPMEGGTLVTVNGTGFDQNSTCGLILRLGIIEFKPINITAETLTFITPKSPLPGTAAFSVALNGQQFSQQKVVADLEKEFTFDFYEIPYTTYYYPNRGPSNGANFQRFQGFGYMMKRPHINDHLYVRLMNTDTNKLVTEDIEIDPDNLSIDEWSWNLPPVEKAQPVMMQISMNLQQWHNVFDLESGRSYEYYTAPHVTSITPAFGHVKTSKEQIVEIAGTGFYCSDDDCGDLLCRFGNTPEEYIFVKANYASQTLIRCKVPQYTKPDVLFVEVTINGESYTSDNKTYGYFDPFVLDANPKLLSTDGSTKVQVKGLGFVDSGQCKAAYTNHTHDSDLFCGGSPCARSAVFVDKNTLNTTSFPQSEVAYSSGHNVAWDPMYIDALVWGDQFTKNQVEVFYYEDPILTQMSVNESPANLQSQIMLTVNFKNNNMERLLRLSDTKCRFTAGKKVYVEEAQLVAYPFTNNRDPNLINTIHCKSPRWDLDKDEAEMAQIDVSLNSQQWFGNYPFTFEREIHMHRDVPMASPNNENATNVKMFGQGYRLKSRIPSIKWGLQSTEAMNLSVVKEYTYTHDGFLDTIKGTSALKAYESEAARWPRVDTPLAENQIIEMADLQNRLNDGSILGVAYIEAGLDEELKKDSGQPWTLYTYEPSSVEFYSYKVPNVLKIFPAAGFTTGGSLVEIEGTWFDYQPQYGIVPHCKFGDKIVRAHFDSTVRLVCASPASPGTNAHLDFEVSLNGIDWSYTNFTFAYFEEPKMTGLYPDMGSIEGGEMVYFMGEGFSNHTDPFYFKCKFTPQTLQLPPKESFVEFINSTTIKCPAPGGWPEGDTMIVSVTQNGIDYDQHHFEYTYYSVQRAFPRSGPSDGRAGTIIVYGQGFKVNAGPLCRLNGTVHKPLQVKHDEIRCNIPEPEGGKDYYGNVDFAISPNGGGSWYPFEGGFQYYEQPVVEDIDPKMGPSEGSGVINFYGDNFRADYPLAELGCKIGTAKGKAQYISERQIKCVIEDMPLPAEDQDALPAMVSLNSYSYTAVTEKTMYRPYGIRQLSPNSGPIGLGTTVIVTGQGFSEEPGVTPRCRFGTPASYAIVEAEILSYTRLACQTPEVIPMTEAAALPRDLPFAIALSSDDFEPWTKTSHVYRFYEQPQLDRAYPSTLQIGRMGEVYVKAAEGSEFFEPLALQSTLEKGTQSIGGGDKMSGLRCKFGGFGDSSAVYINETFIKCTTPPYDGDASTIYKEYAPISVAMNGADYGDDVSTADFTFSGGAPFISFVTIILVLAVIALFGYAVAKYIEQRNKQRDEGEAAA